MGSLPVVVGIDNGGTTNNVTVLSAEGAFLVDRMVEVPSRVTEGPVVAIPAMVASLEAGLLAAGVGRAQVGAVGLDTPGPASATGVLSARGATNFLHPGWAGYDVRAALEDALGLPVTYNNDGNAAALYAHRRTFGEDSPLRSSVAAIVGTGLGGGVIDKGEVVRGAAGMAGELGHVPLALNGLVEADQPVPACNCGLAGDVESFASLTGITNNLLPYWLTRYPDHPLAALPIAQAAREVRAFAEEGDEMARRIFAQQAAAIGRVFTVAANFTDPDAYFVGGGVVECAPEMREWFLAEVIAGTQLRAEQLHVARFAVVPDLDMAGARGSAYAALELLVGAQERVASR